MTGPASGQPTWSGPGLRVPQPLATASAPAQVQEHGAYFKFPLPPESSLAQRMVMVPQALAAPIGAGTQLEVTATGTGWHPCNPGAQWGPGQTSCRPVVPLPLAGAPGTPGPSPASASGDAASPTGNTPPGHCKHSHCHRLGPERLIGCRYGTAHGTQAHPRPSQHHRHHPDGGGGLPGDCQQVEARRRGVSLQLTRCVGTGSLV
jgi:hypothetical protein